MNKAGLCAFLLMITFAAAGLCEMNYTLVNPHIQYEKTEGMRQTEDPAQTDGAGISLSDMAAAQEVQQQDADTWPKTFTITLGGARVKRFLVFRVADEGNHGVKRIHEYRAVFVHVGAARQGERGGKQHEQQDNGGFFHGKSYLQRSE